MNVIHHINVARTQKQIYDLDFEENTNRINIVCDYFVCMCELEIQFRKEFDTILSNYSKCKLKFLANFYHMLKQILLLLYEDKKFEIRIFGNFLLKLLLGKDLSNDPLEMYIFPHFYIDDLKSTMYFVKSKLIDDEELVVTNNEDHVYISCGIYKIKIYTLIPRQYNYFNVHNIYLTDKVLSRHKYSLYSRRDSRENYNSSFIDVLSSIYNKECYIDKIDGVDKKTLIGLYHVQKSVEQYNISICSGLLYSKNEYCMIGCDNFSFLVKFVCGHEISLDNFTTYFHTYKKQKCPLCNKTMDFCVFMPNSDTKTHILTVT
jgi:hypothetical protein